MHPDPGSYEERYRLSRVAKGGVSASVSMLGLAIGFLLTRGALPVSVIFFVLAVITAVPAVVGPAIRRIAFRADQEGMLPAARCPG